MAETTSNPSLLCATWLVTLWTQLCDARLMPTVGLGALCGLGLQGLGALCGLGLRGLGALCRPGFQGLGALCRPGLQGLGALCRLGLQGLGWVYSAVGERGGGGLRRLHGELSRHRREALEEHQGSPVVNLGEKVQDSASRWDEVMLFPQEQLTSAPGAGKQGLQIVLSTSLWFLAGKINPA